MIKRKSSSSAHNYSRVLYSRDSLSLCQHVGISPVLSSHSRASITQRHSSSSSSVNTKGHHARDRRWQQPNKKNKKGGTYYTHRRKRARERKIKEKKGESRNPISWHPQCWMLDAGAGRRMIAYVLSLNTGAAIRLDISLTQTSSSSSFY
jgi:hypothetical protein